MLIRMNNTQLNAIRGAAQTVTGNGQFAVMAGTSMKMGWLTKSRADEYARYYRGGRIVTMTEAQRIIRSAIR